MMHITEICIKKQMVDTVEVGLHSTNKHTGNVDLHPDPVITQLLMVGDKLMQTRQALE